jgi:hypothetical protein
MVLSLVLSKSIFSACLLNPDAPLEPKFYSVPVSNLNIKDFLVDKSSPVITPKELHHFVKKGFDIDISKPDIEIYITTIDKSISIPQIDSHKVQIVDFEDLVMGFNYILVNFDAPFIRQHECKFENLWNEVLTRQSYGIKLRPETVEEIDTSLIYESLDGIIENTSFVYANPYTHVKEEDLAGYLKTVLKNLPQFSSKLRLAQINYDYDLKYFALSVALNFSGIDTNAFFKENPLPTDVNIFNLKGLKNFKISKNDEEIQEGIKPNKILTASTKKGDTVKFSSSSLKAEISDSILYIFDNRDKENEKK